MSYFQRILEALRSPYPSPESIKDEVKGLVTASLIVATILYVLRPFGMQNVSQSVLFVAVAFGGVTFVVGFIYAMMMRSLINIDDQTLGIWIIHILGLIICIALGNVLLLVLLFGETISLEVIFYNIISTAIIGIFPITFFGFQNQIKLERRNAEKAKMLYEQLAAKREESENEEMVILAIQAMENYIHIYQKEGNQILKTTKRQTLQSAGSEELYNSLIKCHRSYLFNPNEVTQIEGNAQGLKLTMNHPECPIIPVSRSFIEIVRSSLHN